MKLQSKDLRIGNVVTTTRKDVLKQKKYVSVLEIDHEECDVCVMTVGDLSGWNKQKIWFDFAWDVDLNNIKPIPLTAEMLEKVNLPKGWHWGQDGLEYWVETGDDAALVFYGIKHLHELQNAYWAASGFKKELDVTKILK